MTWRSKADHSQSNIATKQEPVWGAASASASVTFRLKRKQPLFTSVFLLVFPRLFVVLCSEPWNKKNNSLQSSEYNRPATRNITHLFAVIAARAVLLYHQHHIARSQKRPSHRRKLQVLGRWCLINTVGKIRHVSVMDRDASLFISCQFCPRFDQAPLFLYSAKKYCHWACVVKLMFKVLELRLGVMNESWIHL